jgi:hypothetical protein
MAAETVFPMHCSGLRGYERLKDALGADRVSPFTTGEALDF